MTRQNWLSLPPERRCSRRPTATWRQGLAWPTSFLRSKVGKPHFVVGWAYFMISRLKKSAISLARGSFHLARPTSYSRYRHPARIAHSLFHWIPVWLRRPRSPLLLWV